MDDSSFRIRSDITRIGIDDETLADNPLFLVATKWGYSGEVIILTKCAQPFNAKLFKGVSTKGFIPELDLRPGV